MHYYTKKFLFRYCIHHKEEDSLLEDYTELESLDNEEFQEDLSKVSESPKLEFKAGNILAEYFLYLFMHLDPAI